MTAQPDPSLLLKRNYIHCFDFDSFLVFAEMQTCATGGWRSSTAVGVDIVAPECKHLLLPEIVDFRLSKDCRQNPERLDGSKGNPGGIISSFLITLFN